MIVAGFAGRTDLGKAAETANEVRRVMKDLKDCQSQGVLFNQRERLFSMQVTQVINQSYSLKLQRIACVTSSLVFIVSAVFALNKVTIQLLKCMLLKFAG